MKSRKVLSMVTDYAWKSLLCAIAYSVGLVMSRIIFHSLRYVLPRMPEQADELVAGFYLLAGSVILAAGLAPLASRLKGAYRFRWAILTAFIFINFGISNPIEDSIYSSTEGTLLMIPVLLLPCILLAGILTLLFKPSKQDKTAIETVTKFFKGRTLGKWVGYFLAAIAAFPIVYFIFGIIVSPIVIEYYRQGTADLVLPDTGLILSVQILRSLLFLLASLPVLILWSGTRLQRIVLLGIAFFVLAATFEIVMAYELPAVLRITHSIEILADSMVYAWLLVKLLVRHDVHG